jgi:hypothetical protein
MKATVGEAMACRAESLFEKGIRAWPDLFLARLLRWLPLLLSAGSAARSRGCLLLLLVSAARASAQFANPHEYQLKAVFLFNFAQFVEWPAETFADPQAPLVIGVLGEDPFGPVLDEVVRNEIVRGRALVVQRHRRVEDALRCHILFISQSESARLEQDLAALRGRSILTVSDAEGFALRGVMIRFMHEKNRLRLRINLDAAKGAGLVVSSKLLRPAEIVTTPGK